MIETNFIEKLEEEIDVVGRHLMMLKIVKENGPIGIIKLSEKTGFPAHKVRYSLRILEEEGLIKPSPSGAVITEKTEEFINNFKNILSNIIKKLQELENKL